MLMKIKEMSNKNGQYGKESTGVENILRKKEIR